MSMAGFGLALLAFVAVLVITTGLPAYVALLLASVAGACAGLASGAVTQDLLGALPGRLFNLLENDLLQALPLYLLMGALLNRLSLWESFQNRIFMICLPTASTTFGTLSPEKTG